MNTATKIQTANTISSRSCQLLAYADDIDIIRKNVAHIRESFLQLSNGDMRLAITEYNKEYIVGIQKEQQIIDQSVSFRSHTFVVLVSLNTNDLKLLSYKIINARYTMSKKDEDQLKISECKILRSIYGCKVEERLLNLLPYKRVYSFCC